MATTQGGRITIVNATKYDWKKISQNYKCDNMNDWNNFPNVIPSGHTVTKYIEFGYTVISSNNGRQEYQIAVDGVDYKIAFSANYERKVFVEFINFDIKMANKSYKAVNLDWQHNGNVSFILGGDRDFFFSNGLQGDWMQQSLNIIGNRQLQNVCIPGSHDAGMSEFNAHTAFATRGNTITQSLDINQQLELGVRFFDVRPVISSGKYFTGHYSKIKDISWQGANGQSIDDIIKNINEFTGRNKELIILKLSHDLNTDKSNLHYPSFNKEQWTNLFKKLRDIKFLFTKDSEKLLKEHTINEFIGNGKASVIIIVDADDNSAVEGLLGKEFYKCNELEIYDSYSETHDFEKMSEDQLKKMSLEKKTNRKYFLLSWTLTQDSRQAVNSTLEDSMPIIKPFVTDESILAFARKANPYLHEKLFRELTKESYPNIIYQDDISGNAIAATAMAVNYMTNDII